jgi:hypothetical protein
LIESVRFDRPFELGNIHADLDRRRNSGQINNTDAMLAAWLSPRRLTSRQNPLASAFEKCPLIVDKSSVVAVGLFIKDASITPSV